MNRYRFITTALYRRQYKKMAKQGQAMSKLDAIIDTLVAGKALDAKHRDHPLTGNLRGNRECHIEPDWLLTYRKQNDTLILTAVETGSHSGLFG
jgi:mRNA interferase YafQ